MSPIFCCEIFKERMNLMSSRTRLKSVSDRESAADMGMRSGEPPARIRFAPRIGYGKVPSLRDDVCGDGSRRFYNRTSAVVARATGVTG